MESLLADRNFRSFARLLTGLIRLVGRLGGAGDDDDQLKVGAPILFRPLPLCWPGGTICT